MKKFGDKIEELRSNKTQREFAKLIGVPLNTYTNWTRGIRMPSIENIVNICVQLGVSADWLLGITEAGSSGNRPRVDAAREKDAENDGENGRRDAVCLECAKKDKTIAELAISVSRLTGQVSTCNSPPETGSGGYPDRKSRAG